jgi:hypothetical protein
MLVAAAVPKSEVARLKDSGAWVGAEMVRL